MLLFFLNAIIAAFLIGSVILSLAGCGVRQAGSMGLEVRQVYSSAQCDSRTDRVAVTWLDSPAAYASAYRRLTLSRMGAEAPPQVDFADHGVLLIEMGRKSTGGYGVALESSRLSRTGDLAQVHVSWIEPAKRAIVPQVVSSPCLMLELPKADFSKVQVVDQQGVVRESADSSSSPHPNR